jgi:hypothetical protein
MDEKVFSQFIKFLDKEHEEILNKIKVKREELRQLETEFYNFKTSRGESISRELYALRSEPNPDMEKIQKLQEELETLPTREQLENEMNKLKQEIEELQNKFSSLPFELPESIIVPHFSFQVEIDGLWIVNINGKYYVKENLDGSVLKNYKVEVNEDNLPIRLVWLKQDSDTRGIPLWFSRGLKIVNPVIEIVKPVKREIVKEIPEYKEVKVSKFVPSLTCPRCSWNLSDKMRLINCPNCGLSLFDAVKLAIEKELGASSLKENKKDKKKRWMF